MLGILPTLYGTRYRLDSDALEALRSIVVQKGISVFEPIPRSTGYDRATSEGMPTLILAPKTPGIDNYHKLADEIINRYGK